MKMWMVREYLKRQREKIEMTIAWALPKSVVKWCVVRVGAHATQGIHESQIVPELNFTDALQRWDHPNK